MSPGEPRVYLDSDKFSENRELHALVDSGSTKSILGKEGIELAAEFNQEIKPSEVKAILLPNGSTESVLGQVALPSTLDVIQIYAEYKVVPNLKYQCVLGMDAIRQFRFIVDGNAKVIRMAYGDEVYRTATIDLLSNLVRIDDDGCAVIKELTKTQTASVENFLKRELKVAKKELSATHLAKHTLSKHTIDVGDHPPIKQKYHVRSPAVMDEMNKLMGKLIEQKLVEPSNSAWSSPVVMARKSNGTYCLCIAFRKINRVTKKYA